MALGWDDALMMVPAAINIAQQAGAQGKQGDQFQLAMQNLRAQEQQQAFQREMTTAGRTDARGNKVMYIPGQGWVSYAGPEVASQQSQQDDLLKREMVRQATTGEGQRNRDARRLVSEGEAADPLLAQFEQGYGMPTRGGVRGKQTIANVTGASENADRLRNAATSTALRTGASTSPLGGNLSSLDRNATAGIRTALAQGDVQGDQMYESMYKAAAGNKLDPYKSLTAGGAAPFKATDVGGDAATSLNQAATVGGMRTPQGNENIQKGYGGVSAAIGNMQPPAWDTFAYGIANLINKSKGRGGVATPSYVDNEYSGRTSSGNTYG